MPDYSSYNPQQAPADGLTGLLGIPSGPQGLLPIRQQPSGSTPLPSMLPTYDPTSPPPAGAMPPVGQPPSFLQNIGTWFKHAVQHAGQTLVPTPANDLYSPTDLSQGRHQAFMQFAAGLAGSPAGRTAGLAGGLANGLQAAQAGGQNALQSILQQRMQGVQIQQYQGILAARQRAAQQYAPAPGDTPVDLLRKNEFAAQTLALANDPDGAKMLSDQGAALAKAHGIIQVDAPDRTNLVDGATGAILGSIPKGLAPQPYKMETLPPANTGVVFNPATGTVKGTVGSGSQITPQEGITDTTSLGTTFHTDTKDYWDRESAYNQLKGAIQAGNDPNTIRVLFARLQTPNRAPGETITDVLGRMGNFGQQLQNLESQYVNGKWSPGSLAMLRSSADDQMLQFRSAMLAHRQQMYDLGIANHLPANAVDKALERPTIHLPGDPTPDEAPLRPAPGGGVTRGTAPTPAPARSGASKAATVGGYSPANPYAPRGQ